MGSMNDILLSGTISGSAFDGTATAGTNAGSAFDIAGATGELHGGIYGPNAAETSGSYFLTGGPKETALIGSFGATQAASDRRLKEEIQRLGELANGLKLYSWRYIGGSRRFTGVMAQDLAPDDRFANAIVIDAKGLMWVDYGRLGFIPDDFAAMRSEGEAAIAEYRRHH